ncbi:helix-turn-helix domain-containing protein [Corynebacterium sp. 32222D000AT]|uniref:helix-turn-helix domain-containing protein n=1 Tax=unclassified Corynebacterium TaxID=2624378 RepID=UPI002A9A8594|nr:helix-turn-helix transcriptional regulator [Mycobacteriaceae bacterium]MDY5828912.1 helix-turn-helix transcriptional regulator [Corynebacterium sp.]
MYYDKFWQILRAHRWRKQGLRVAAGLSSSSITKLSKEANLQTDTLIRICEAPNCGIADICERELVSE